MRYLALATDYDGVVAREGRASQTALAAIGRLRMSGRRAILITGRRLANLQVCYICGAEITRAGSALRSRTITWPSRWSASSSGKISSRRSRASWCVP